MKNLRLGDFILGTICGAVIIFNVANIYYVNTTIPDSKIEKSK